MGDKGIEAEIERCKKRLKEIENKYHSFVSNDLTINPQMSYEEYCRAYGDNPELVVSKAKYLTFQKSIEEEYSENLWGHETGYYENRIRQLEYNLKRKDIDNLLKAIKLRKISVIDMRKISYQFEDEVKETLKLYGYKRISNSEWQKMA